MRSQNRWRGIVVGVFMGVLFSAAVVLGESPIYLPIVLKDVGSSSAGVPRTGQTTSYGPGDDGALQKGVVWPNPRFTVNANGTVTDNLSGLIWLKNANCFGLRTWALALSDANGLTSGGCGLSDGSTAGQWRLPNVKELQSLIDWAFFNPALSNAAGTAKWTTAGDAFTGVQSNYYWSSSTFAVNTVSAWFVNLSLGYVYNDVKSDANYVWPVRGGQ